MARLKTGFDVPYKTLDAAGFDPPRRTPEAPPPAAETPEAAEAGAAAEEPKAPPPPVKTPPRAIELLEKVELTKEYFRRVDKAHDQFCKVMATGAEMSFLIGKALSQIKMKRDQGVFWKDFVEDNFKFSLRAANRHIRMYERFKDNPEAIRGKTIAELNGDRERAGRDYAVVEEGGRASGEAPSWDAVFAAPTVSGAPLKNYRFEMKGAGVLYMYNLKTQTCVKSLIFTTLEERRGAEKARSMMMGAIQSAVERYYAAIEAEDGDG